MLRRLAWILGTRLIDWSEGHIDVVARARELEQRHTEMVIERVGGFLRVQSCGRTAYVWMPVVEAPEHDHLEVTGFGRTLTVAIDRDRQREENAFFSQLVEAAARHRRSLDDHDPKRPYSEWWHFPGRTPES